MAIVTPAFTDVINTSALLNNTDIKEYTKQAWISLGDALEGAWINDPNNNGTGLETAEQIDGSWRVRGTIQNNSTFDTLKTVVTQTDFPPWRRINFLLTEGYSFGFVSGVSKPLAFNYMFGTGSFPFAALGLGFGTRGGTDFLPINTDVTFNLTLYVEN